MRHKLSKEDVIQLNEIDKSVSEMSSDKKDSSVSSQEDKKDIIVEDLAGENKVSNEKLNYKKVSKTSIPYEISFCSD